jgi:catechol 2,3-dioxygenase-like lactoylglutathione lyase family enzyme
MIVGFDHVAITVADLDVSCDFFVRTLDGRVDADYQVNGKSVVRRVVVGKAVLNIHQRGNGVSPVALHPQPGSADICFRWGGTIESAIARLREVGVVIEMGPVPRVSAEGNEAASVYFRDPDGNLHELLVA